MGFAQSQPLLTQLDPTSHVSSCVVPFLGKGSARGLAMAIDSRYGHWRLLAAMTCCYLISRLSSYSCYIRTFLQKQPITARRPQTTAVNIPVMEYRTMRAQHTAGTACVAVRGSSQQLVSPQSKSLKQQRQSPSYPLPIPCLYPSLYRFTKDRHCKEHRQLRGKAN